MSKLSDSRFCCIKNCSANRVDTNDICPDFDDNLIGTACDDGNDLTVSDTYDISNSNIQSVTTMIYTMEGKEVYSQEMQSTSILTIDTQHLPEASYILRLRMDDGRTFIGRFVKL